MINSVVLSGNLTRDPQIFNGGSEKAVAKFSIAQNRKVKGEESVSFFDCTCFGKTADIVAQYFSKGKPIIIQGSLQQETWTDDETNQKRSKMVVIVRDFTFAGGTKEEEQDEPEASPPAAATKAKKKF